MDTRKINILIVDDDKNTCIYTMKMLSIKSNWDVDIAWKVSMALELVKKKTYDAVVLDYRMPGMNGDELCRKIKELQPHVRVVFLTGYTKIDTVFSAIEAGAERVLAKPVDPAELVQVLEEQSTQSASLQPLSPHD